MKRLFLLLGFALCLLSSNAQQRLLYQMYSLGSNDGDTTFVEVKRCNKQLIIQDQNSFSGELIPGISTDITYVDYEKDSAYYQMSYSVQKLRHTPLFIAVEMCKYPEHKLFVKDLLPRIITRADIDRKSVV